jgi:hypothetical protein
MKTKETKRKRQLFIHDWRETLPSSNLDLKVGFKCGLGRGNIAVGLVGGKSSIIWCMGLKVGKWSLDFFQ